MARTKVKKSNVNDQDLRNDRFFRKQVLSIDNMIGQSSLSLYGTDRSSEVDSLNQQFQDILNNKINDMTNSNENDITSFLGQIISSDRKNTALDELYNNQFLAMSGDSFAMTQSFIFDAYRNKLLEQNDLHEISSQLIELSEAILITRDAIISSDVVEGRMSRTLKFDNLDDDDVNNYVTIVEHMEDKFDLLKKIKNFIIPKTLEYGEYYVYHIPYAKLFGDFAVAKDTKGYGSNMYSESTTILESFDDNKPKVKGELGDNSLDAFIESAWESYNIQNKTKMKTAVDKAAEDAGITMTEVTKEDFANDLKNIMGNISVENVGVPLPVLEEGFASFEYFKNNTESVMTEADKKSNNDSIFKQVTKLSSDEFDTGIHMSSESDAKKISKKFEDITDCYIKLIDPTRVIPIEIMNTVIGYYYVVADDITPLSGAISNTLYYTKYNENQKENTIIDSIAERVVKSFDKPFLEKNAKFKKEIVECIQYYNLNEKRLKFQFISPEYMQVFKIDEDENGHGQSMIKKSLFYAKLYLMLLLFKIMTIIMNSNDTKVNYVRSSGIDKDIANKVQDIIRLKQSKTINIADLFSYTTLINKVGNGSEMYVPTGRSNERPVETEILSGQDVQLNSDLLEMLKNAYILGTGVPAAIINYLNEADFAKVIEQNNTKFNGRVVNYQLDFNPAITNMYKNLLRWTTTIPENVISNFSFILQPPKTNVVVAKSEIIGNFQQMSDFITSIVYDDPQQNMEDIDLPRVIRHFKLLLAKDQLTMLNFSHMEELAQKALIEATEEKLKPSANNGDNGDDEGFLDEEMPQE